MSAESDVRLSRKAVIAYIHAHLHELSNDNLETIINIWMGPRVYYGLVSD